MHSPFPWITHPQAPINVYDADGMKAAIAVGPNAEDNAALIAAIPAMVAVLKAYEQWEADIIMERKCWGGPMPMQITGELFDRMLEIQGMRNAVLASIGKKP